MLLANAGRVLPRDTLIDRVWGSDYVGDTKTLDVHVKRLRSKIEPDPANPTRIVTIRGLGYKYERGRRLTGPRLGGIRLGVAHGCRVASIGGVAGRADVASSAA